MNLSQRLRLMVLPLLVGIVFFAGIQIEGFVAQRSKLATALELTRLSVASSALVHELQRERGSTALFLGAKGESFGDAMRAQRSKTDDRLQALKTFLLAYDQAASPAATELMQKNSEHLQRLEDIRRSADAQSSSARDIIAYYTAANAGLLQVSAMILDSSPSPELTRMLVAYYNLLQGKERAGIERALLSNAFSTGQFAEGAYARFIGMAAEQRSYLDTFQLVAGPLLNREFLAAQQAPAFARVEALRADAMANQLQHDAKEWFTQASARIDLLKTVEDDFAGAIDDMATTLSAQATRSLAIWSLIVLALLGVSVFLIVRLSGGIRAQVNAIFEVMEGAATRNELGQQCPVLVQDELGQIAMRLNEMLRRFSGAIRQLREASAQLADSAQQTASASDSNASSLDKLKDATLQVVAAVEEMSATIAEVARNTEGAAEATRQAENSSKDSQQAIVQAVDSIQQAATQANVSAESINQLHDSSKTISSVLGVIRGIADQTNLLALNAAIEAARAGDQGRGFAVVADEVRTLAQRTQQSTVEIEKIVGDFERISQSAYQQMQTGHATIHRGVAEMNGIQQVLNQILVASTRISAITGQIAAAVHQQSVVSNDISAQLHGINEQTLSTASGGEQIATAAGVQTRLALSLNELASSFRI